MEKINESLIASTFEKVKDVDIFSFKAYIEKTESVGTGAQGILLDIFVNFPFFLLNAVVGVFSIILRFFEDFSLYDTYRQTVFDASKNLWVSLSGSGSYNNSLLYVLISLSAFSIFIAFIFSKGDFAKRLVHLFVVIILGLTYFGTIQSTSGGVYILDTVHEMANSFSDSVTNLSIKDPSGNKTAISQKSSVADNYIRETSYTAYLFVNTGQLNGNFYNNKAKKEEVFNNEKVLGKYDKSGNFIAPSQKDILDYVDHLGNEALEGNEKNRWVSAVNDYIWLKSGYVIFKIFEAIILAVPLVLIQLIAFLADIIVIILMIVFPLALIISFIPKMQDIVFNVMKVMLGAVSFPALAGFLTLIVFYIQTLIATFIKDKFTDGKLLSSSNLRGQSILFMLVITVIVQGCVFYAIWKYKEQFLKIILGSKASQVINNTADKMTEKANDLGMTPKAMYEKAHDLSSVAMMGVGYGVGKVLNAQDNWNSFKGNNESFEKISDDEKDTFENVAEEQIPNPIKNDSELNPLEDLKENDVENIAKKNHYDRPFVLNDDLISDVNGNQLDFESDLTNLPNEKTVQSFDVETEFERLKENKLPKKQSKKIDKLETELNQFSSDQSYFEPHGNNAFQKGFNASKRKEVRLKHNLERKSKVLEELEKLRGGK
ncbi:hypothetical protein ACR3IL_05435 [Streptococcus iniae]